MVSTDNVQLSLFDDNKKQPEAMQIYMQVKGKTRKQIFLGDFMNWLSDNLDKFKKKNKISIFKGLSDEQENKFMEFLKEEL